MRNNRAKNCELCFVVYYFSEYFRAFISWVLSFTEEAFPNEGHYEDEDIEVKRVNVDTSIKRYFKYVLTLCELLVRKCVFLSYF